MDFLQPLRDAIIRPMKKNGPDGVADSVNVMKQYSLLRSRMHLPSLLLQFCLCIWNT
jgi:hypothetical protein